ncbi:hypothetical protein A2U01_0057320, partial [Trifolium medium]|nr:hypothetical protein [Trifolium medium]
MITRGRGRIVRSRMETETGKVVRVAEEEGRVVVTVTSV